MSNDDDLQQRPQGLQRPPTLQPTNALAGPSTIPQYPALFLPDPVPERRKPKFTSTDDLISRFQLLPTYDRYVRPYVTTVGGAQGAAIDKGKGKEREREPSTPAGQTPGAGNDAEEEEPQTKGGEKKWRNNYKHLIKDIPGKHSMKKEDYLVPMMQVPPKQRNDIKPFDLRTQREAFSVSLEGLKGWNINVLVAESPQAREDRKRRKELKRLAKAQAQAQAQGTPAAGTPSGHPATPSVGTPGHPPVRTGTPKPNLVNNRPSVPQSQARGKTPVGVGTPRSASTPGGPQSHVSVPTSNSAPQMSTPAATPNAGPTTMDVRRGIKREREDSAAPTNGNVNHTSPNNNMGGKPSAVLNAKPGVNGVRPRKKQRMQEPQGQPMAVQQPTPRA
ncbi:hypothetical protein QCA50_018448 [Cerrena zonata]|uniref:Mediator of RNA polymerase II transcription subunit 19 n=1 Tax=Cerrena zonata TaxID=2478898 RepID=A0AAW0FDG8_9APHY